MLTIDARTSHLLVIDFQARLMPAIHDSAPVVQNAGRLLSAARRLELPISYTEQNPKGLGTTLPELAPEPDDGAAAERLVALLEELADDEG